ncbi:hypothetical protein niasHT_013831 [Heterodera trifolii]|uniref:BTB domain-containing protein n=1 Tax=Heterodera trifolii TaxID=157864 RepID=A0ABD2KTV6_9BILA
MKYIFYYVTIFSVFCNLHVKSVPPKDKAEKSDGHNVNLLEDKMKEVLDSGKYSDVQFLVGKDEKKEIVSAHRIILSVASDVFEEMFRNDEQNSQSSIGKDLAITKDPILVPDIEIEAFKALLTFIYTKHLNGLDANNLFDVLKAADKFKITALVNECVVFPIEKLHNVFVAFEQAELLNMEVLALRYLRYIDQNMSELIKSEAFLQIDQALLCKILQRDQLRISELRIWNAALCWADEQCRVKMASNVPLKIGAKHLARHFSTDVLTKEEMDNIYQHYSNQKLNGLSGLIKLKFPIQLRYKYEDTIEMEIEKVSEFALEEVGSRRFSDAVEIGGFSWKIMAKISTKNENNAKWLAVFLEYAGPEKENWTCKNSAKLRIFSNKKGTEDLIGTFVDRVFNKEKHGFGFPNFITFAKLMDPSKGLYNEDEDKVTLAIDVIVDAPKADIFVSDPNKSNGTLSMEIEKLSDFAREVFGERKSETVYIKGMPWKIVAYISTEYESTDKCLTIYLLFDVSEEDGNWSRKCSATFRIVSQKSDVEDMKEELNETVFNNEAPLMGFKFIDFAELMDPSKGLYNEDEDKVTLAIDVTCE